MDTLGFRSVIEQHGLKLAHLAKLMDVDKATVTRWAQGRLSAERAVEIERVTGIPRAKLRPDLFGQQEAAE